jgi:hypothetical protein
MIDVPDRETFGSAYAGKAPLGTSASRGRSSSSLPSG